MPVAPSRIVNQRQVAAAVQKAAKSLAPDIVRIRYTVGLDSTGLAAIFFRVLLSDQASGEDRLYETTRRISRKILDIVKPMEKFGMEAYFNFRSVSEQAQLKDAAWE
jgi:hypothetical protein